MAVHGRQGSVRQALLAGASLVFALIGLFMFAHEGTAHDACAAIANGARIGLSDLGLNCGFSDTVYWAGIVICVTGFLSFVATSGTAMSVAIKSRAQSPGLLGRTNSRDPLGHFIDPNDPVTRWRLDPATDWRPGPAGWQAGPRTAAPFIPPVRDSDEVAVSPLPERSITAEDVTVGSGTGVALLEQARAVEMPAQQAPIAPRPEAVDPPSPPQSTPQPAWYPDPEQPDAIRWWDGENWGESRTNR
jgi:hypothetical protein